MAEKILNTARWDENVRQWMASGGPRYSTSIVSVQSGDEQRTANWVNSRGMWNVGDRNVPMSKYQDLLSFFHRVKGRAIGFRVRDWTDFRDDGRGVLGVGVGDGSISYQMHKRRAIEGTEGATLQKITRPVGPTFSETLGNTVRVFWNGLEVPQEGGPGTCSVNDESGVVLFIPYTFTVSGVDPSGIIDFTGPHNLSPGDWLTLDGFSGGQEQDNGRTFRVVESLSPTSVQVLIDGPALVGGSGPGTASLLPGPTDSLTWTGLYDYPARFDLDSFDNLVEAFIEGGDELSPSDVWIRLGGIPLIQLRE